MLDWFSIFSKGGFILWCFQGATEPLNGAINSFIRNGIVAKKCINYTFEKDDLIIKYLCDNEFNLMYVVAYQRFYKLSYMDKFLSEIEQKFRDQFRNVLNKNGFFTYDYSQFSSTFHQTLQLCEKSTKLTHSAPVAYIQSKKFEKTIDSMKTQRDVDQPTGGAGKKARKRQEKKIKKLQEESENDLKEIEEEEEENESEEHSEKDEMTERHVEKENQNKTELFEMFKEFDKNIPSFQPNITNKGKKFENGKLSPPKQVKCVGGKKKQSWAFSNKNQEAFDYSTTKNNEKGSITQYAKKNLVGNLVGELPLLQIEENSTEKKDNEKSSGLFGRFMSLMKKTLTEEMLTDFLTAMKDKLIVKNVASDVADKLCSAVGNDLLGQNISTFEGIGSIVRRSMENTLQSILTPKRRINVLRDVNAAKQNHRPYIIVFCGVNGVGKSTNLAKICFWLNDNDNRVLIAACDTFRSGAVEQLRTHYRHLNELHPGDHKNRQMVELFDRGYGKDAATVAQSAIQKAKNEQYDVVLVDTAGRMQDNEPLMKSLSKLIDLNEPDLVLFVGEALVGNEAVDQLTKFNNAIIDNSSNALENNGEERVCGINGIVLTKFDTIDDKVGAAVSMTYTTGQPIIFVGTGQQYGDLMTLNAQSVTNALLR
ncbi:hypothetical protein SNEBB_008035 [Seison nebaliae]|nr:hypothetical protein SNEBB_008035 [Seison nebaliae]